MTAPPRLDANVERFYAAGGEAGRLAVGPFRLERARTQVLLQQHLPAAPAQVADVGGGPGAYACWLAGLGYEVTLVDPVALHVEQARRACSAHPDRAIARCEIGDARALGFADASFDAVLMLGPLYHLQDADDRRRAWGEAARAVRPGGVVLAAAISRYASLIDGFVTGALADPEFQRLVERDLRDGCHVNDSARPEYFTTAYFHRPEELAAEAQAAGLESVRVFGVEGPAWAMPDFETRWNDAAWRERMMSAAAALEAAPSIVGLSAHMLAIARRPEAGA